jgi:hypothetical protein
MTFDEQNINWTGTNLGPNSNEAISYDTNSELDEGTVPVGDNNLAAKKTFGQDHNTIVFWCCPSFHWSSQWFEG